MVACRVFHLVCHQLIQPLLQFLFQSRSHEDGAAGGRRFGAFQDEGSGAAFQLVREHLDDAAIVYLVQCFFSHPLHGLVDTERSDAIRCIKVNILRGQTYDLALSQCAHQREVDCQMQDGVIHAVQSCSHFLYRPDDALLRGLLGAVHGNRTFNQDAPLYGILERCTQQPMNLVDSRAGKEPLLLLFGQFLLFSLDIRTAGRFAQGRIEVFHVGIVQKLMQEGQPVVRAGCFGVVLHRQAVLTEQAALLKRAVRQMIHTVLEVNTVLFDGERVGKGQQLDGLQNVGDLFGQAGGDIFLDVLQDALLDLALVLHRAVQRVQRSVDAFQRPLFQKGAAKLDFIDLLAVVPVRP